MSKIVNLTQHKATESQRSDGVFDLPEPERGRLVALLTFEESPRPEEIQRRALELASLAKSAFNGAVEAPVAMVGGAPYLAAALERALRAQHVVPVYSFSRRIVTEEEVDGVVQKKSQFVHGGFVHPPRE